MAWLVDGLFRLDRRGLTTYDLSAGLKSPTIVNIGESRDGTLYAASDNFFLSQFDGKGFQTIRPQLPPDARGLWNSNIAFQDHAGEWWLLTNEKLYRFAASRDFGALARQRPLATYSARDGLKGDNLFHIFEDSKRDLWVSVAALLPRLIAVYQNGIARRQSSTPSRLPTAFPLVSHLPRLPRTAAALFGSVFTRRTVALRRRTLHRLHNRQRFARRAHHCVASGPDREIVGGVRPGWVEPRL